MYKILKGSYELNKISIYSLFFFGGGGGGVKLRSVNINICTRTVLKDLMSRLRNFVEFFRQ